MDALLSRDIPDDNRIIVEYALSKASRRRHLRVLTAIWALGGFVLAIAIAAFQYGPVFYLPRSGILVLGAAAAILGPLAVLTLVEYVRRSKVNEIKQAQAPLTGPASTTASTIPLEEWAIQTASQPPFGPRQAATLSVSV